MKTCMVYGDMSSDSAADQYPSVTVCDDCVTADMESEEPRIVAVVGGFDSIFGDECHFCDKSKEEEDEAKTE